MSNDRNPAAPSNKRFAAFEFRDFGYYWSARFCATLAVQIMSVAVAWHVYDLTRDPFDLGIIGLVQFLPSLLLVLVTGTVADRYGRRRVMMLAVALECLCAGGILMVSLQGLSSPTPIFVALTGVGIARAFFGPASQSLVVNLVPRAIFPNAVAWNSASWQTASILGPVAGGLMYGIDAELAYSVAVVMLAISFGLLSQVPPPPKRAKVTKVTFSSLFDGLRFIRQEKIVLGAISLDLFAVLLGGAVALMPVYARDILQLGPSGLGILRAAPGVGAILMLICLASFPIRDYAGRILLVFVGLFGLFTTVFGLSTIAWISIVMLALMGAADMISVVIRETLLQLWTSDDVRGRVNAVNMVFIGASNELGGFRAGFMGAWIGVVPAVVFGGVGAMLVAAGWAWLFPQLRDARFLDRRK